MDKETEVYKYHYTGSQQQQIGGDGPIPGSTWSTAHDNPMLPGYISLGPGPIYGEVTVVTREDVKISHYPTRFSA